MAHKSGVEIWSRGYVCGFRRRVLMVWAQTACRANCQSGNHYPWKSNCPWRNATNKWTSSRHCVPVTHLSTTERCCCCTCCKKHGRWRPEYLQGLDIIQYFPPKFSVVPPEDSKGNIVDPGGAQEKSMKQGAGHNFWKNDIAQGHKINQLKWNGSKMADKSNSTKPWFSVCKLKTHPEAPGQFQDTIQRPRSEWFPNCWNDLHTR